MSAAVQMSTRPQERFDNSDNWTEGSIMEPSMNRAESCLFAISRSKTNANWKLEMRIGMQARGTRSTRDRVSLHPESWTDITLLDNADKQASLEATSRLPGWFS